MKEAPHHRMVAVPMDDATYGKLAKIARGKKRSPRKELEEIAREAISILDRRRSEPKISPRRRSQKEVEALSRPYADQLGWSVPQFHKYAAQALIGLIEAEPSVRSVPGLVLRFDRMRQNRIPTS